MANYAHRKRDAKPSDSVIVQFTYVGIMAHYWNGGYTIGMVAILLKRWLTIGMVTILLEWWLYYWNGGYTIEIVAIIFLYKLISSSFVIIPIPSHTSYTSLNGREKGSRVKEES